jgi:hypothetical protein
VLLAALVPIGTASVAQTVIMDPALVHPGATLVDFESVPIGAAANPLVMGGITFSNAGPGLGCVDVSFYQAHGTHVAGNTLLPFPSGSFQGTGYTAIRITFAAPVAQIGLGWFDPNFAGNRLRAYDTGGNLIAEGTPQLGPPGGCCAAFLGVIAPADVIAAVEVVPDSVDDWYSIDMVRYHRCSNVSSPYGQGCPGTGAVAPVLSSTGCTTRGTQARLSTNGALGGAQGLLLLGSGQTSVPLPGGCDLLISGILPAGVLQQMGGSGAGGGSQTVTLPIPNHLPSGTAVHFQAVVLDPHGAAGFVLSNGLRLTIE